MGWGERESRERERENKLRALGPPSHPAPYTRLYSEARSSRAFFTLCREFGAHPVHTPLGIFSPVNWRGEETPLENRTWFGNWSRSLNFDVLARTASERRKNIVKGCKDFRLTAKARFWSRLSYMRHVHLTAVLGISSNSENQLWVGISLSRLSGRTALGTRIGAVPSNVMHWFQFRESTRAEITAPIRRIQNLKKLASAFSLGHL